MNTAPTRTVTLRQAEAFVGLRYADETFDCAHLAVLVQRALFGRTVGWAEVGKHPRGARGQAALIARHRGEVADEVAVAETGDAVLFTELLDDGNDGCRERWHIGTVFVQMGERWVLHTSAASGGSVLQREADCLRFGLQHQGYWRWRVVNEAPAGEFDDGRSGGSI